MEIDVTIAIASVIAGATPVLLATVGETINEKAGIINLSLDGSILLSAMVAFAVAFETNRLVPGFVAAALVGALVSGIVAVFSIYLGQSQVAVGFVLTLMTRDLAYFLGNPYTQMSGPQVAPLPVPLLSGMPLLGRAVFTHSVPVYVGMMLIGLSWWYIYRTPAGLQLRAVGEHPRAAWARGFDPRKRQLCYTLCGGLLVGLAGATFSLYLKPGWGRPQGAEGTGWIALALVIFGGWHPVRAAMGAYLFSFLQVLGIYLQGWLPSVPAQVFHVAPFPLMIFTLLLLNVARKGTLLRWREGRGRIGAVFGLLTGSAPGALGKVYRPD